MAAIDIIRAGPYVRDKAKTVLRDGLDAVITTVNGESSIDGFDAPSPVDEAIYSSDWRISPQHDAFVHLKCRMEEEFVNLNIGVSRAAFKLTLRCGHRQQVLNTDDNADAPTIEDAGWTRAQMLTRAVYHVVLRDLRKETGIYDAELAGEVEEVPDDVRAPGVFAYDLTVRVFCKIRHGALT
jgi:hypothetical protein